MNSLGSWPRSSDPRPACPGHPSLMFDVEPARVPEGLRVLSINASAVIEIEALAGYPTRRGHHSTLCGLPDVPRAAA
jgi:hypothetical protein